MFAGILQIVALAIGLIFARIHVESWRVRRIQLERMEACREVLEQVEPSLRADSRFDEIVLRANTSETITLSGSVESLTDAEALLGWAQSSITAVPFTWLAIKCEELVYAPVGSPHGLPDPNTRFGSWPEH